ncbi:MAG: DUF1707 domain-containing protein [Dermatophilaceae bacterium]|nr:DUF1707 domain-containing protein [Intrasporangiaceae bacterium]
MSVDDPARPLEDADRTAAVSQLRRAAEDGRLAPQELDRRIAKVRDARLVGELGVALAGLPPEGSKPAPVIWPSALPAQAPTAPQQPQAPSASTPPGYRPDDRLALTAGMSDERRSGHWTIPPYVRLQAAFSKVKLDCRHAEAAAPVIDIEIGLGADNVVLVVPAGWGVDTDRLSKGIGTIKVKVPRAAAQGCPTLVFHGQLGASTLIVREENWVERRLDRRAGR